MRCPADQRTFGPLEATLYFLPVRTRVPLKFGAETLTSVTCARVCAGRGDGRRAPRARLGRDAAQRPVGLAQRPPLRGAPQRPEGLLRGAWPAAWATPVEDVGGHPLEVGHAFLERAPAGAAGAVQRRTPRAAEPMPWLAALVCCSAFDLALHDAYGIPHGLPVYQTYAPPYMNADLARFLTPAAGADVSFAGRYPADFLVAGPDDAPGLAPGRRQGPARPGGAERRRAGRRLPGAAARLDPPRRPELPQGQAARRRRRPGTTTAWSASARSPSRRASTGSRPTSTARSPTRAYVNDILDRLLRRAPPPLRHAPLRRAALPLRPGGAPHRRARRLGAQAAVHGRERPRLAPDPARARAGLDRRGPEDLQDADRAPCWRSAGPRRTA